MLIGLDAKSLLMLTARVSIEVSDVETGGEIPDFFGATYAFLAEECFDDALHDRAEKFQRLFPAARQRLPGR